jgi:uncharacterized RDD family membrane protein YckC
VATEHEYAGSAGRPGGRLGLPAAGPGSTAGWGRRIVALIIDWMLSTLVIGAFLGTRVWSGRGADMWGTLAVFGLEKWVLTALLGGSAGQLLVGIGVAGVNGPIGLWRPLVRSFLVCLVIPAVIYNRDNRGLHDLLAGTVVVRRRA